MLILEMSRTVSETCFLHFLKFSQDAENKAVQEWCKEITEEREMAFMGFRLAC